MTRDHKGQATVEFALVLPVFVMLLLLVVQVALVLQARVSIHEAAREAARAASLDPSGTDGPIAARRIVPGSEVRIARSTVGAPVRVEVRWRYSTDVVVVGPLIPDPLLVATSEMRAER